MILSCKQSVNRSFFTVGSYTKASLGLNEDQTLHHNVFAGSIFGSTVEEGYALVSCTVVPGFYFADFKLFTKKDLLKKYPKHKEIIDRLAYDLIKVRMH